MVWAPHSRISSKAAAPSPPIPVIITPTAFGRNRLCHRPASNIDARSVARDQWSSGDLSQVTEYPFERFVSVMSILERHSNWDCSLLLGCSMTKIAQARMKALRRLPDFAAVFPRGHALRMRRLGVTRNYQPPGPFNGAPSFA